MTKTNQAGGKVVIHYGYGHRTITLPGTSIGDSLNQIRDEARPILDSISRQLEGVTSVELMTRSQPGDFTRITDTFVPNAEKGGLKWTSPIKAAVNVIRRRQES